MYHSISDEPEPDLPPYYKVNTAPSAFRRQMEFLALNNYQTISLRDLLYLLSNPSLAPLGPGGGESVRTTLSRRPVVLTFDDGFHDFYTGAFPILQEHGFSATMFLPTAFIRSSAAASSSSDSGPFRRIPVSGFLSWLEIRELHKHGIEFGSHTVNHAKLVELQWPQIKSELSNSKSAIEDHLGERVSTFCYPFAFPQANRPFCLGFERMLAETGYSCCATTALGRVRAGANPFRLRRLPANSLDDSGLFAAKLEGAYDWMAVLQSAAKRLKSSLKVQPAKRCAVPTLSTPRSPSRPTGSYNQ
jgi:peptidoglycan/xylan/chitin deacetylase (PgdA/CDA1 family)